MKMLTLNRFGNIFIILLLASFFACSEHNSGADGLGDFSELVIPQKDEGWVEYDLDKITDGLVITVPQNIEVYWDAYQVSIWLDDNTSFTVRPGKISLPTKKEGVLEDKDLRDVEFLIDEEKELVYKAIYNGYPDHKDYVDLTFYGNKDLAGTTYTCYSEGISIAEDNSIYTNTIEDVALFIAIFRNMYMKTEKEIAEQDFFDSVQVELPLPTKNWNRHLLEEFQKGLVMKTPKGVSIDARKNGIFLTMPGSNTVQIQNQMVSIESKLKMYKNQSKYRNLTIIHRTKNELIFSVQLNNATGGLTDETTYYGFYANKQIEGEPFSITGDGSIAAMGGSNGDYKNFSLKECKLYLSIFRTIKKILIKGS